MGKIDTVRVSFMIPKAMANAIDSMVGSRYLSRADAIRDILRDTLDNHPMMVSTSRDWDESEESN